MWLISKANKNKITPEHENLKLKKLRKICQIFTVA